MPARKKDSTAKTKLAEDQPKSVQEVPAPKDWGAGFEEAGQDAYAIPFLRVIQKGSPEVDETHGKYIPEAKAGMLVNSITGELFDRENGCFFIPCYYQQRYIRWAPRGSAGQGYRGEYTPDEVAKLMNDGEVKLVDGFMYFPTPDGTVDEDVSDRLQDTRNHFGLLLDAHGNPQEVLLSLTSTQIKKSKHFMTWLNQQRALIDGKLKTRAMYRNRVQIVTVPESNEHGSWFGVKFTLLGEEKDELLTAMGDALKDKCRAGIAKVDYSKAEEHEFDSEEEGKYF